MAFPSWTKFNYLGMRDARTQEQPPKSSTIYYDFQGKEKKCNIVMDNAQTRPEWLLKYTIPEFERNLVTRFDLHDEQRCAAFGQCLFGLDSTYWLEVLAKVDDRDDAAFVEANILYFEKVDQVQNLQDSILRWVSRWKKPFVLLLKEFVHRCEEMYSFA